MTRAMIATTVLMALASATLAAEEPTGKVLLDQSFEMATKPGPEAPAVGSYTLRAVEFADRIDIAETITVEHRGQKIGFVSTVVYERHAEGVPTASRGKATTTADGQPVMIASFRVEGRKILARATIMRSRQGDAVAPPRQWERTIDLPEGPVVTNSAIAVIGPRLLGDPGETQIAWVEFPDDVDEAINVKQGFRLARSAVNGDGVYELTVRSERQNFGGMPIGAEGRIRPYRMFGKLYLRERKPGDA
jgi:hypothetical protein